MLFVLVAALIAQAPVHEELIPPAEATESPIVMPPPPDAPRVVTRQTRVDRGIGFQNVTFGTSPEVVAKRLARYRMAADPREAAYPTYAGSGDVLGERAAVYASFSPRTRKLFTIAVVSQTKPGEPRSALTAMFETRRRILTEKYGLPAQETYTPEGTELVWLFRDGQLQCELARGTVSVMYFHDKSVALSLAEQDQIEAQRRRLRKNEL
ncbi:MAG: hypothetical protein FJZ01_09930 [Candidatus Sericytochromatia bacterium]|nr:hypothetical protein [Candidatus Tanganyikabacteria bacterium]